MSTDCEATTEAPFICEIGSYELNLVMFSNVYEGCEKLNDRKDTENYPLTNPSAFMPTYSITRGCQDLTADIDATTMKPTGYKDYVYPFDLLPYADELETQTYSTAFSFKINDDDTDAAPERVRRIQKTAAACLGFYTFTLLVNFEPGHLYKSNRS